MPTTLDRWFLFWRVCQSAAALTNGVAMEKTALIRSSEFEALAQETVSLALVICERRIKANQCKITPELKALSAAALSLEKAVTTFIAAANLCN